MILRLTGVFLTVLVMAANPEPCSEYGCPHPPRHEPFLPALPGHTPRCAKPGQTFCERLDHYPQQLIRFLIDKWSFDYNTLLIDESRDGFNSYRREPEYHRGYNYQRPEVPQLYPQPLPFLPSQYPFRPPAPIYGPPTNKSQQGYSYPTPSRSPNNPFLQPALGVSHHPLSQHLPQHRHSHQQQESPFLYSEVQALDPLGQPQGWWPDRYTRSSAKSGALRKRPRRSPRVNPLLEFAASKKSRSRRQANASSQATPLCPTNSQFIMPKAALNNRGNWMYVVNLQEQGDKYTQLVKSETCASDTCNGLCTLPTGYTSRCQQQYVQKRLVALEGSGDRLYTDVFWFPHCCTCQITSNN
ncbi:protein spaetzle 5 isoform X1 [Neodiprion virginianus]|uniref:protein spaetzle 5 isoform X1 n=1 Tax=Neodiprion virginianus TaxID=2961670 RepID=UPI001EE71801|nr:protein spaetzle 5 isoform X1 [Neodiprion virginianus]XP_046616868.1 protein spaetzle 5 isoform X1 [Neodiprion virginianus]